MLRTSVFFFLSCLFTSATGLEQDSVKIIIVTQNYSHALITRHFGRSNCAIFLYAKGTNCCYQIMAYLTHDIFIFSKSSHFIFKLREKSLFPTSEYHIFCQVIKLSCNWLVERRHISHLTPPGVRWPK